MRRLLISAAEPSGDILGASLVESLNQSGPIEAFGLAGPAMRAAGVEPLARMEPMCAMGVVEVVQRLPAIRSTQRALRAGLEQKPDALLVIDAPDLHLPLARYARAKGIPAIGWVSPQVWAWRPGRARTVCDSLDHLLCLFDFEPPLFDQLDAHWVGHPVIDRCTPRTSVDPHLIGLTPGSRQTEVERIWPHFVAAATEIRRREPQTRFCVVSPVESLETPLWIERGTSVNDLSRARAVLTKSGTITLELAVMGIPQVVAHRVHPITYGLGRHLVQGIRHIAMPNILAGKEVVPEFIQTLDPVALADAILGLPEAQDIDLSALGTPGAINRTANHVRNWMGAA
jgi:lipid-A-disaccharide synthase